MTDEGSPAPAVERPTLAWVAIGIAAAALWFATWGSYPKVNAAFAALVAIAAAVLLVVAHRSRSRVALGLVAIVVMAATLHGAALRITSTRAHAHDQHITVPAGMVFSGHPVELQESMAAHAEEAISWYAKLDAVDVLRVWAAEVDVRLAWLHSTLLQFDEAEQVLRDGLAELGPSEQHHIGLGRVLRGMQRETDALEMYEQVLRVEPRHTDLLDDYAPWCVQEGIPDRAIEVCDERLANVIPRDDAHADTRLHTMRWRSLLLREAGRIDESIEAIKETLAIDPDNPNAWFALGQTLAAAQQLMDAEDALLTCIQIAPDAINAHLLLAQVYSELGRADEAARHLEIAARIERERATDG